MFKPTSHSTRALIASGLLIVVPVSLTCRGNASPLETVTINFDDLRPPYSGYSLTGPIPATYQGFEWYGFWCLNTSYGDWSGWGYGAGVVSGRNIAYNRAGNNLTVFSRSLPFDFNSAYLTSALLDTMQVEVRGFVDGILTYDNIYTVEKAAPTLIAFDYREVQRVEFWLDNIFVIDDLVVTIPEPSITSLLALWGLLAGLPGVARSRC